jgi:predicted CoA-binding protein
MRVVAVIGASRNRQKFGNKAVRAFHKRGYHVVPVNPRDDEIEGLQAFPTVGDVPTPIDLVTLYLPPDIGERVIAEVAALGVRELWLNPGAEGPRVIAAARRHGIEPDIGCSIVAIGESPADYE